MALHPVTGLPVITDLNTKLWFGRYKGTPLKDILHDDPDYLVWAQAEIKDFDLHWELLEIAERQPLYETCWEKYSEFFWR